MPSVEIRTFSGTAQSISFLLHLRLPKVTELAVKVVVEQDVTSLSYAFEVSVYLV